MSGAFRISATRTAEVSDLVYYLSHVFAARRHASALYALVVTGVSVCLSQVGILLTIFQKILCCGNFVTTHYFLKKNCVVTKLPQHNIF